MKDKSVFELANRMNQIEWDINKLELEYNKITDELKKRMPHLENDVNLQPKETLELLINELIDGSYQDDLGEYTRIYPINNCCKERLNIVKKKIRKHDDI